jgi:hypothetical protein
MRGIHTNCTHYPQAYALEHPQNLWTTLTQWAFFLRVNGLQDGRKKRAVARSVGTVAPVFKTWLYCEMVDGFET